MPFQSEKQRRYLWANEPEIARDWTDTYGSRIHKDDGGIADLVEIMAREPAAFGGIMGDDGRRAYGFGSFIKKAFRKATKAVKKIAKSPIGKAALLYAGTAGLGSLGAGKGLSSLFKLGTYGPKPALRNLALSKGNLFGRPAQYAMEGTRNRLMGPAREGILGKWGLTKGGGSMMPTGKGW